MRVVARRIHVPWTTVKGWYINGYQPRHDDGEALCELYRKVMDKDPPREECGCGK